MGNLRYVRVQYCSPADNVFIRDFLSKVSDTRKSRKEGRFCATESQSFPSKVLEYGVLVLGMKTNCKHGCIYTYFRVLMVTSQSAEGQGEGRVTKVRARAR